MSSIRKITSEDIPSLKNIIESTGLFPADLLDAMMSDYLSGQQTNEIWITYSVKGIPVGLAYCAPERMTDGTYNLYLIAIHKNFQGQGIGTAMMHYIEETLRKQGVRIVLVETSALAEFELTRKFYLMLGYSIEATIREFYQSGEGKVIFWKKL